jgi:hypothetical protein
MIRTFIRRLTGDRSAIELCFQFIFPYVGPVRFELTTLRLKAGYILPIELRANVVATIGFEPIIITL